MTERERWAGAGRRGGGAGTGAGMGVFSMAAMRSWLAAGKVGDDGEAGMLVLGVSE